MQRTRLTTLLLTTFSVCGLTACQAQNNGPAPIKSASASKNASVAKSSSSSGSAGAASDGHTWHLKREERSSLPITDWQTNQKRTIKMASMLVPVGWDFQTGIGPNFGDLDCDNAPGGLRAELMNPEKNTGIVVLAPSSSLSTNSQAVMQQKQQLMQNFKVIKCRIEEQIALAPNLHQATGKIAPGSQNVGEMEPVPGLSEELPGIVANANRSGNFRLTAEAGRQRFTGTFRGKESEMWLVAMATHRTEPAPGGTATINSLPLLAILFAPPGQLDRNDKLLTTLLGSLQVDQEWTNNQQEYSAAIMQKINGAYAQVAKIHQQMAQDNANAAAQQQAIRNNTANYRNQVMSSVAANRSAALSHSSQQFALYMGDQAIYKDPSTGQHVQMTGGYDHVWASTTGNTSDYILTDSPSYDPNGKVGSSGWTQMEVVH